MIVNNILTRCLIKERQVCYARIATCLGTPCSSGRTQAFDACCTSSKEECSSTDRARVLIPLVGNKWPLHRFSDGTINRAHKLVPKLSCVDIMLSMKFLTTAVPTSLVRTLSIVAATISDSFKGACREAVHPAPDSQQDKLSIELGGGEESFARWSPRKKKKRTGGAIVFAARISGFLTGHALKRHKLPRVR